VIVVVVDNSFDVSATKLVWIKAGKRKINLSLIVLRALKKPKLSLQKPGTALT